MQVNTPIDLSHTVSSDSDHSDDDDFMVRLEC